VKHRLLTFAGALALLAVLGKFYAVPAIAQAVRAAVVKNIDERGRTPYQTILLCNGLNSCVSAAGIAVPAHSRLVIEHVSGFAQFPESQQINGILLTSSASRSYIVATFLEDYGGLYNYGFDQPHLFYVEAGDAPVLQLFVSGAPVNGHYAEAQCQISGYIVDLSQ
jgi:hypothetical protein